MVDWYTIAQFAQYIGDSNHPLSIFYLGESHIDHINAILRDIIGFTTTFTVQSNTYGINYQCLPVRTDTHSSNALHWTFGQSYYRPVHRTFF